MARSAAAAEPLTYAEARRRVLDAVRAMPADEAPLAECRGRALRRAIRAAHALPPFRNSSMDGYAVRAADTAAASPAKALALPVVEVLPAGRVASKPLGAGQAMRIMTGAPIPEGADAVVPVEDVQRTGLDTPNERIALQKALAPGQNVREAGRDLAAGAAALEAGRELSAHDLALLAALGEAKLMVSPRPRAVVISTGDELLEPSEALQPGRIRDSNRLMLGALLEECGVIVARSARLPDDPARVAEALKGALSVADVVLTIGGVSAGDFDPVKQGIGDVGDIALWKVAMKPGAPQAFGTPGGRLMFGLPGNPASVACTFEALVRPALRKLMGYSALDRPRVPVRAGARIESRAGRVDFVRVALALEGDAWRASPVGEQVSGHLVPQSHAHALLIVPEASAALEAGDPAEALVLRWPERAGA